MEASGEDRFGSLSEASGLGESLCRSGDLCYFARSWLRLGLKEAPPLGLQPQWLGAQTRLLDQIMVLFPDRCWLITTSC